MDAFDRRFEKRRCIFKLSIKRCSPQLSGSHFFGQNVVDYQPSPASTLLATAQLSDGQTSAGFDYHTRIAATAA